MTPDGQYNAANLNRLLSDLASVDGNKVIRFASGTYNFMSYIEIMKVNDLWLVGEDDTLFLYSGWVSYMRATLSKNINIKNIQFDMKYSPTIAGTITKVDESGSDPVYNNRLKEYSSYMECYYDEASGKYTPDYDGNLFYNTTTSNPAYMGIGKLSYNSATRELSIPLLRQFPWWSYRTPNWQTNDKGRRLDHVWISPALAPQLQSAFVLKEYRGHERPSDHVPIGVVLV